VIIGSGMGGATVAAGLAPTGAKILVLERGQRLRDSAEARDPWGHLPARRLPAAGDLA
jgi:choline dehydrogenase-like flavoprotein